MVHCPALDSLRGAILWLVLLGILLVRKANRTVAAWAILFPLLAIQLILSVAEGRLNAYFIFHYHQYLCSSICELMRLFALALAILLAMSERTAIRNRFLRWAVVTAILLALGSAGIGSQAWPFLGVGGWTLIYTVFVLIFMAGNAGVKAVLGRLVGRDRFDRWYEGFCLVWGIGPVLILGGIEFGLSDIRQPQGSLEALRFLITLGAAVCLPYLVLFWFVLLARFSPRYRERLGRCLGFNRSVVPDQ